MAAKDAIGRYGEQVATNHLEQAGYTVLDRNWRCQDGEIDLVARDGDVLVFCEVKTRSGMGFGDPAEAVGRAKSERLRRLAVRWMADRGVLGQDMRFDVVSVLRQPRGAARVRHLRGAF